MRLMRHGVEGQHDGWIFINSAGYGCTLEIQICAKHIVHGEVASLVDRAAFHMVEGGEYSLGPNAFNSSSHTHPVNSCPRPDKSRRGTLR